MGARIKSEKNSLVLLSSKRTKADSRTRADEAFALPSFPEATPTSHVELHSQSCKEVAMEHDSEKDVEKLRQTMLQHEAMFREQVRELHRLYQVQRLMMTESKTKESVIYTSSDPRSSNGSLVYSSESLKNGERHPWEAMNGSKISFRQAHQHVSSRPAQMYPSQPHVQINRSQEVICHPERFVNSKSQKVVRRMFDLERPAEEYMDIEQEEEKYVDGDTLMLKETSTSNSFQAGTTILGQSLASGKDAHSSLSTCSERDVVGATHGDTYGRDTKLFEENRRENHFLFERAGCSEVPFFPIVPSRTDFGTQEALGSTTTVLPTKSLLGGLSGVNHESQWEDSGSQKRDFDDYESRRNVRQSLDPGSAHKSSKPPRWLLQGPAALMKAPSGDLVTQNSVWHQPLPSFLQKQEELDLPNNLVFIPGEKCLPTGAQELAEAVNACSISGTSLHQNEVLVMGSQVRPSLGLSPNRGGTGQGPNKIWQQFDEAINLNVPAPLPPRHERGAHLFPAITSNVPSLKSVDVHLPGLPNHATPVRFLPGPSSRGAVPATQPWFQLHQNGLSFMQQRQAAELDPVSLPLPWQRTSFVPPHVGSVAAQPPAGGYVVPAGSSLSFTKDLGGDCQGVVKDNATIVHPEHVTSRPGVSWKRPAFGSMATVVDVELTLGLSANKVDESSESLTKDVLVSYYGQITPKPDCDGLSFMGHGFVAKAQSVQDESSKTNSFLSESFCTVEGKTEAYQKVFLQDIEIVNSNGSDDANSIKASQTGELQILHQKASTLGEREEKEIVSLLHLQKINDCHLSHINPVIEGHTEGDRLGLKALQDQPEQLGTQDSGVIPPIGEFNNGSPRNVDAFNQDRNTSASGEERFCSNRPSRSGEIGGVCKSSDVLAATKCEVRDPHAYCEARDEANTGGGQACQNHMARQVHKQAEDLAWDSSSNIHFNEKAQICENADLVVGYQPDLNISPVTHSTEGDSKADGRNNVLKAEHQGHSDNCTEESTKQVSKVSAHIDQAADILLSLASDVTLDLEKALDLKKGISGVYAASMQDRSLEWFANLIPQENDYGTMLGHVDATTSSVTGEAKKLIFNGTCRDSQLNVENEAKKVTSLRKLDDFESATLNLKPSVLDSDECSSPFIDACQAAEECQSFASRRGRSSRRGRGMRDFQREMLPSIASLSRQEITEDMQTIGGLMRSCLAVRENGSSPPLKNCGGVKGNYGNGGSKSCKKEETTENPNGFTRICSWGESTRRRHMRRHRSRWPRFPVGVGMFAP